MRSREKSCSTKVFYQGPEDPVDQPSQSAGQLARQAQSGPAARAHWQLERPSQQLRPAAGNAAAADSAAAGAVDQDWPAVLTGVAS